MMATDEVLVPVNTPKMCMFLMCAGIISSAIAIGENYAPNFNAACRKEECMHWNGKCGFESQGR